MKEVCREEMWQSSLLRNGKYLKSMRKNKNKDKNRNKNENNNNNNNNNKQKEICIPGWKW